MSDSFFGELSVIGMRGCEKFVEQVDFYLREWRSHDADVTYISQADCPRFGSGEGKGLLHESMRGHDVYILADCFNHGVTYRMYGQDVPMSPDEHFQDLKRTIAAIGGKARRTSVIMPMLYEGRQHKRSSRESLDCAIALQELVNMGVSNIITFDAHDPRVSNAIPLTGFDNVRPTYQMLKALVRNIPDISLSHDDIMIISPDEGAMSRTMYYASVMGLDLGMFYKRRNYAVVIDGKNPIEAHEYLGKDVQGKDVIVIDDMISSGDSILDVARQLKDKGAKRIFFFVTFGLFTAGYEAFDKAYEDGIFSKCFTTNLTYHPEELIRKEWYADVNMCKYVALIIDTLNQDKSIGTLLNPVRKIHNILNEQAKKHDTALPFNE
ncbi:MAG: ribose-phosphate pyrophosphokinase [Eubacteriales bacterium]|mgnify:FL=1|nr:ribose-phosphate pyrophosphokinase [Clostridiales bacterium]MDD7772968.1 ribose-phosphate pyrophosphokinase [Eubacteriales bacterium]MDY3942569.1 ribose-phosphate pyrophosphokinase [Eubacteriales bacterium]